MIALYSEFTQKHNYLYLKCIKHGILKEATKHMKKTANKFEHYSNEELLSLIPVNVKNTSEFKKYNSPLHSEFFKRKLLGQCGLAKPRKCTSRYDKSVEYFNSHIVPLIESGLTLNQIASRKLIPFTYNILEEIVKNFAGDKLLQKLIENKSQSYKNKKRN